MRSFWLGLGLGVATGVLAAPAVHKRIPTASSAAGSQPHGRKLRILILGGGFAGYYALRGLERCLRDAGVEITLINRQNYMLFTSMLHEVAASDLDAADIVNPLHKLVHNGRFFCGEVRTIDLERKTVLVAQATDGQTRTSHETPTAENRDGGRTSCWQA